MATYNINTITLPTGDVLNLQDKTSGYITSVPVTSVNTKTGDVALTAADVGALPSTTVIPAPGTGASYPAMDGTRALGTDAGYARVDHVHPTDTSRAPLDSPEFTGTPTAPTPAVGTDTAQIATTSFVNSQIADAIGDITGISYEIVASLPATGQAGVIYLVSNSGSGQNVYDEYIYVSNKFEKIGTTETDLSGYVPTSRKINNKELTADITLSASAPTFTGTQGTVTVTGTPAGSVTIDTGTGTANYTPEGTVSKPTFTGSSSAVTITSTTSTTGNYTPDGTVSQPTFTGTQGAVSVTGTPAGDITIATGSGTANYTPAGSVTISKGNGTANYTPEGTISVTPTVTLNTTTVNSITAVGTLPVLTFTPNSSTGNLDISWDAGTLPTQGANTTVATSVDSATATGSFVGTGVQLTGSFAGTAVRLTGSFTGTSMTATGNFTPEGTVSQPTFTGTKVQLAGSTTAAGSVSQPTFTGTGVELTGTFSGSSLTSTGNFTPAGTVSAPTIS